MKEPNAMLSNKDVLYISDILMIQYTFIKKLMFFSDLTEDIEVNTHINKVKKEALTSYDSLLEVLNG